MHILYTQAHTFMFLERKKKITIFKIRKFKVSSMFFALQNKKKAIHLNLPYVSRNHF